MGIGIRSLCTSNYGLDVSTSMNTGVSNLAFSGLQIISRLTSVKLSGQTYFCSDISHFWPDKHRLRLIAIKVPPHPFTWCLNMKQVNFQSIYCTWASISMQEKWNAWYSKSASYHCFSSASYIRLVMKLMKLTEACNLVDFKCCQKQGSSFTKMRDWTFKIQ